jgi:hypothetical protein
LAGAIWGATTFIITEGLAAIGEIELAREINLRFYKMATCSGMSENYHALTVRICATLLLAGLPVSF